jgi:pSer/pThr/pTyr-binding forkhead associated (FHA) protein
MVQFDLLTGKKAGTSWVTRRFPVTIGRAQTSALQVEEEGVWDEHLRLELDHAKGFVLSTEPNALASVNGQQIRQIVLRNGDRIQIGGLSLRFFLSSTRQGELRVREWLTWLAIATISLGQVALIYWMLP